MVLLLFLLLLPVSHGAENASDRTIQIMKSNDLPALAGLRLKDGKTDIIAAEGIRKSGDTTRVNVSDQWHLGSNGKAMTAVMIAMLVDEKKLKWSSTLGELFPDVRVHPSIRTVSVEQILVHRSGIAFLEKEADRTNALWKKLFDPKLSPVEGRKLIVKTLLTSKGEAAPNSEFKYYNLGYALLGAIIERILNEPYETVLRDKLFYPLDMLQCGFGPAQTEPSTSPNAPWGHERVKRNAVATYGDNPASLSPAGTMHCSLKEWSHFIQFEMDGFNTNSKYKLLSREAFKKIFTIGDPKSGFTYGAWLRYDHSSYGILLGYEGDNTLNHSNAWLIPARNLAALSVTNMSGDSAHKGTESLNQYLLEQ